MNIYRAVAAASSGIVNEAHYTHYWVNPSTGETGREDITKDIKREQRRQYGIRGAGGALIGATYGAGIAKLKRMNDRRCMKLDFKFKHPSYYVSYRQYRKDRDALYKKLREHRKGDLKAMGKGILVGGAIGGGANVVHYGKHKDDAFDGKHGYDQNLTLKRMASGDPDHLHAVRATSTYSDNYNVDGKKNG